MRARSKSTPQNRTVLINHCEVIVDGVAVVHPSKLPDNRIVTSKVNELIQFYRNYNRCSLVHLVELRAKKLVRTIQTHCQFLFPFCRCNSGEAHMEGLGCFIRGTNDLCFLSVPPIVP